MTVLNRRNGNTSHATYIGRGSPWGNPFVLRFQDSGKLVQTLGTEMLTQYVSDRDEAIERYRKTLHASIKQGWVTLEQLAALDGCDLACYCAPLACHGDVLARAASWAAQTLAEHHEH